ncbi:PucR family transcriptional regulator [Nocardioides bruguierae]|uniref:PucR family transcriptional regulator n=1 Tax=Nocardioides bruguierae TaxID=2945102 RepID=UPI002021417F|nr:helix-turn-helix domain-containing protein [Nocardioides bruguierae]MCL8026869.1 helix-turn-helix domain-containing protein [Nocardioides bruguierae]
MTSEVQQRFDELGRRLGRSVVLNDPEIRLVLASEHFGDEDPVRVRAMLHRNAGSAPIGYLLSHGISTWTRAGRVPPSAEHELLGRLVAPVRLHGELLGFVVVIDADASLTDDEVTEIESLAQETAGLIVAERHAQDRGALAQEARLLDWLSRDAGARASAQRQLAETGPLPLPRHLRALAVEIETPRGVDSAQVDLALRRALESTARTPRGHVLLAVREGRGVLLLASPVPLDDEVTAARAAALIADVEAFADGRFHARVGIGAERTEVEDAWLSHREAELACRAADLLGEPVVDWNAMGPLRVLVRVPREELDETAVPPVLDRLAEDPHGQLLETLEAFLECGGSGSAAATRLHVHRTTLYYRLDRIREVSGLDLDDGDVRLELHLGLLVRRVLRRGR